MSDPMRIRAQAQGEKTTVRVLVSHEMESGQRKDAAGKTVPAWFIQSISAGTDQYDKALLHQRGIRLASAAGVNAEAVAEHAMALMLALARRLPEARDNQNAKRWRGIR